MEHGENVFYFFYKITGRKLQRGNSLIYQSVNSTYMLAYAMAYNSTRDLSMFSIFISQSKFTFVKCYFIIKDPGY